VNDILLVFAHPDDETFSLGGTIAALTPRGAHFHLVTATSGGAGRTLGLVPRRELARTREGELREATGIVGVASTELLGYADGRLQDAPLGEITRRIAERIRTLRPRTVITFPPDGINRHPDHVAIHRFAHRALRLAANANGRLPGKIFRPEQVLYIVAPPGYARAGPQALLPTHGIDIRAAADRKRQALVAHRTQARSVESFVKRFPQAFEIELLHRAEPPAQPPRPWSLAALSLDTSWAGIG